MKRGVAPIISTMLLIVIVVIAFSILWQSIDTWLKWQRSTVIPSLEQRIVIEDVWFRTVDGKPILITLYVRNIGGTVVNVTQVSINGAYYPMEPQSLKLGIGEGGWLNVSCSWTVGKTYEVKAFTDGGVSVEMHAKAP